MHGHRTPTACAKSYPAISIPRSPLSKTQFTATPVVCRLQPRRFRRTPQLATQDGVLRLRTTLTTFVTANDVFLSEIRLEAFLTADDSTAELLRRRASLR